MSNSPAPSVPAQPFDIDVSIVLPTYNERDNICDLIDEISQKLEPTELAYEVLVMDDDSPDRTAQLVNDLQIPKIRAVNRRGKPRGLAPAARICRPRVEKR